MGRPAKGNVVPPKGARRSWGIRFTAYGHRHTIALGRPEDGWDRQRADDELNVVMRDVRLGTWRPPAPGRPHIPPDRKFSDFAEEWFEESSVEWKPRTRETCRHRLAHLLQFFGEHSLMAITVEEVDRYRRHKLREREQLEKERQEQLAKPPGARKRVRKPLSNGIINRTIGMLASILELAVEYKHIDSNPALGKKRRLKESKPRRTRLQPGQANAVLRAAAELDEKARADDNRRRLPLLALLVLTGLRIGEALDLRWRDVHLTERKLWVADSKTDTGIREVGMPQGLQQLLAAYRGWSPHNCADDRVFPTRAGKRDNPSNVRNRILRRAIELANEELARRGERQIRDVTPHSLRRTFVSLLFVAKADLPYAMAQAGHADPRMTLGIYAEMMVATADYTSGLDDLVPLGGGAPMAQQAPDTPSPALQI
jgi:integrase